MHQTATARFSANSPRACKCSVLGPISARNGVQSPSQLASIAFYRIAQEACTNTFSRVRIHAVCKLHVACASPSRGRYSFQLVKQARTLNWQHPGPVAISRNTRLCTRASRRAIASSLPHKFVKDDTARRLQQVWRRFTREGSSDCCGC